MKILYHHRIASKDGQCVHIDEIVKALRDSGHDVLVVGPALHDKAEFGHDGGIVRKLKSALPGWLYECLELGYSAVVLLKLWRAIKSFRPDVIYERYNLHQPAGVWLARRLSIPLLLEVNAPLKEERLRHAKLSLPWLAGVVERYTWKNASHVFPVSKALSRYLVEAGVRDENITVVHNGIRRAVWSENKNKSTEVSDEITIGFVGFMHLTCGVEWAIKAISDLSGVKARLVCIGDGDVVPLLKQKASEFGVSDRVEFTGLMNRDEVMRKVGAFDIALQPDVTPYASPLKMFEYMANKCLILAPDSDNIKEILTDDCAEFFAYGSSESFKAALKHILLNPSMMREKRDSAFERIDEMRFTWESNAIRIVDVAKSCLLDKGL